MPDPMIANIPTAQTAPPKQEDFNKVVDAQANTMEQSLLETAPVGDYSVPRLSALAKALDAVIKLFGGDIPSTEVPAQIKSGKLPIGILLRIAAIRAAVDAWHETDEGTEIDLANIPELNSDAAIALLTVALQKVATDKSFKKFLKAPPSAPAPVGVEEKGAGAMEGAMEKVPMPEMKPSASVDVETVFGKQ